MWPSSLGYDSCINEGLVSPINQQIALKTIKKFGFSVNAVWNGKEALDYLLETPSADHPKPDIILMDVQMPILDGYRATHVLRNHNPYSSIEGLGAVPIIAMTASAIQGDKEKCKEAGMNDYLAKPVKAKTLESMLLKWVRRRKAMMLDESLSRGPADPETVCTDPEASPHKPNNNTSHHADHRSSEDCERAGGVMSIPDSSRWIGCEGDRDMLRCEAEEKATSLRDDKLLAASSSAHPSYTLDTHLSPTRRTSIRPKSPTPALTEENIGILDREHDGLLPSMTTKKSRRRPSLGQSSTRVESSDSSLSPSSTVGSLRDPTQQGGKLRSSAAAAATRGRLIRNDSDRSQVTVTDVRTER